MLSRLVLINSCTYDLAELDFTEGHSMQLVGGNNVGKSSLIYALNFLFLVNRKLMSFSGGRPADKNTMAYYFKEPERSFIVFEIKKKGRRYCIVVYRDGNGDSRYARIQHGYQRDLFFREAGAELQLLSWTQVKKQLVQRDIKINEFHQQQDVLGQVYRTGRNNDAVVWLTKDSKIIGASNSFSKVYRYLINSKLITTDTLRDILLIADNRDREQLSYQQSNMQHVEQLRRESDRLQRLREIEGEFKHFQQLHHSVQAREQRLGFLAATFRYLDIQQRALLRERIYKKEAEVLTLEDNFQAGNVKLGQLQQEKGQADLLLRQTHERLHNWQQQQKHLLALPPRNLLLESITNLEQEVDNLQFRLKSYEAPGQQQPAQLEARCQRLQQDIDRQTAELRNIDNWLVFHLAKDEADRLRLNAVLSEKVARLPREALRQPISDTAALVRLFDGSFQLPEDFAVGELARPEALEQELQERQAELLRLQELLETARNKATYEQQLAKAKTRLQTTTSDLQQVDQLPELAKHIKKEQAEQQKTELLNQGLLRKIAQQQETLQRQQTGLQVLREDIERWKREEQQLVNARRKLEEMALPLSEPAGAEAAPDGQPDAALRLFADLEKEERAWREERLEKDKLFSFLRNKALLDLADEQAFMAQLEGEFTAMDDKESSIRTILNNIAVQFANPAAHFLEKYQEFHHFIEKSFNRSLREINISNIESLRVELAPNLVLQKELRQISNLQLQTTGLFQQLPENDEGLEVLKRYLEQGKEIDFADLFSLRLRLQVGGEEKSVDLAKQVESDGTDRMLRLVIVMQVISRLAELSADNKIVLFIDEIATIDGKNRPQLVRFCQDHHFYPIFAAPNIVDGFDRYVFINRNAEGRLIIDQQKHYMDAQQQ
ncbi:MAG: hypothetical protein C7N36_18095 [Bacteroidetes bacterium]|nr:MAG: hypothetical protein C7N36_18095 [Bacteroidota bacterium]